MSGNHKRKRKMLRLNRMLDASSSLFKLFWAFGIDAVHKNVRAYCGRQYELNRTLAHRIRTRNK